MYPKSETEGGKRRVPIRYLDSKVSGSYSRVGRGASSVSDPRRVLSSGMHKILRWRQRVGQLLYPIPASLCVLSSLSLPTDQPRVSSFVHLCADFLSLSLSLANQIARSLDTLDPKANANRAGRYAHFYALIYAHAFTKNNPRYRRPSITNDLSSSVDPISCLYAIRDPTKHPMPRPSPFHKRENTFAGMQMRSLEAPGHLPYNHPRNDSTLTQSVRTFLLDLTRI